MIAPRLKTLVTILFAAALLSAGPASSATPEKRTEPPRSTLILGCWGDADKGDGADLKLAFQNDGSLVQYDENQQERRRRTFGAWEMLQDSSFLVVYWPNGSITRYTVKRIGPILHFAGLFGVRNFTLRELERQSCWVPKE